MTTDPCNSFPEKWQPSLLHSNYLRQLLSVHPEISDWLTQRVTTPFDLPLMQEFLDNEQVNDETGLKSSLRRLRHRVMALLILRDISNQASLAEVMATMSQLADISINFALDFLHRQLAKQFGEPLDNECRAQRLVVVGMGKLGGNELNVSSDIDLVFIYPEDGETFGPGGGQQINVHDFFVRLGKRLINTLEELTEDGQVFRVDMRLRPYGDSGPLVCSMVSLENYFITQGREWERYAWIRARIVNDGNNLLPQWSLALVNIIRPFVYRKYLDFGAIDAMRKLHSQVRRAVTRKGMSEHIKLGPGGIREIEFTAQVFQLIRGGREAALQVRPTLLVLPLLAKHALIPEEDVGCLIKAYEFLRRLEHRLQYVNDLQTHTLPQDWNEREKIARSMGFASWHKMFEMLEFHRQTVTHNFEKIFTEPEEDSEEYVQLWLEQTEKEGALEVVTKMGFVNPKTMLDRLEVFRRSSKYLQLPAQNRERLDVIGPRLIEAAATTKSPDTTWLRLLDFIEAISRRGAYLAFLQQQPKALMKVAEIIGSSAWAATYLTQHPILLDEVLDPELYEVEPDWQDFILELHRELAEHSGDTERQMDILRDNHHAQVFRLLAQDIAGMQTVERLADHLTELADIIIRIILDLCWEGLKTRSPYPERKPRFAIIAYGKLGGKELSYGADLDLVFVHDDPERHAGELYARLGRRINSWMTSRTLAGQLFDTDFRLRPNGEAGLFVYPIDAFREYQHTKAWSWEHQALTRARFCAGDPVLGKKFEDIRIDVIRQKRDLLKLKNDVFEMRKRMLDEHASSSEELFDIKQDPGGLVDVEFIVQYLVLGYAHEYPRLCGNLGNIALLGIARDLGLIFAGSVNAAQDAYREFRRLQHNFRLDGIQHAKVKRSQYKNQIEAIQYLWQEVFGN